MKSLDGTYLENWVTAFHDERNLPRTGLVALAEEKRIYFLIESYLAGINCSYPTTLNLSSFARVLARRPAGSCAMCLKHLFKERLFPMCRQQGKTTIAARLEPGGVQVFKELRALMPGIELTGAPYWAALVPVPPVHSSL